MKRFALILFLATAAHAEEAPSNPACEYFRAAGNGPSWCFGQTEPLTNTDVTISTDAIDFGTATTTEIRMIFNVPSMAVAAALIKHRANAQDSVIGDFMRRAADLLDRCVKLAQGRDEIEADKCEALK